MTPKACFSDNENNKQQLSTLKCDCVYSGPPAITDKGIIFFFGTSLRQPAFFFEMLWMHFISNSATFVVESLGLSILATSSMGILVSLVILNNKYSKYFEKRNFGNLLKKMRKSTNQIISLFLPIKFNLIRVIHVSEIFLSGEETQLKC